MTNPIRVFARQAAKTAATDFIPGGTVELDAAQIAGLCSGLDRKYYLAARLKWVLDWSGANELEKFLWFAAADLAGKHKWKIPTGQECLRRLAGLAIAETGDPARYNTNAKRAEWMGISDRHFRRAYAEWYRMIYDKLDAWCGIAFGHVAGKLNN